MRHGLYDEAEVDLLAAIERRTEDGRWARTYGLHFLPEYFPNRELGIIHYERADYARAESLLERSYTQQPTARGAHYLDNVRERRVRDSGEDKQDPTIEIVNSYPAGPLADLSVAIQVNVSDDTYIRAVTVNGQVLPLDVTKKAVSFERPIDLGAGDNTIVVSATDIVGHSVSKKLVLHTDHDGPAVSAEILAQTGGIQGHIVDETDVASLEIAGQPIPLQSAGSGAYTFTVQGISAGAGLDFVCRDTLNNVTRGRLNPDASRTARAVQTAANLEGRAFREWIAELQPETRAAPALAVRFTNLAEGQRYFGEDLIAGLSIDADAPIDAVEIDGQILPGIVSDAAAQQVTRRVSLSEVGPREIVARVRCRDGRVAESKVTIERQLPQALENAERLRVALLGNLWTGATDDAAALVGYFTSELPAAIRKTDRFSVVDRDSLALVLDEQELSQMLSKEGERIRVGQINQADFLLVGDVRRFGENLELVLHILSAATGSENVVDVYGIGATSDDLGELTQILGDRLAQEFPMVRGSIVSVAGSGRKLNTSLNRQDRLWPSFPVLVYREVEVFDPSTGQSLGKDFVPLADGQFSSVGRENSVVSLTAEVASGDVKAGAGDFVITK